MNGRSISQDRRMGDEEFLSRYEDFMGNLSSVIERKREGRGGDSRVHYLSAQAFYNEAKENLTRGALPQRFAPQVNSMFVSLAETYRELERIDSRATETIRRPPE